MKEHINSHISNILIDAETSENKEYYTLSTGYSSIDEITQGIQTQKTYLITNEDDSISSEFVHNLALNIALDKHVVLFIDLFECDKNTAKKFKTIAKKKGIGEEELKTLPIFIENEIPNIEVVVERIMNFARFTHVKVLIISSIEQIMSSYQIEPYENKRRIMAKLISLAKEFNIALVIGHGKKTYYNTYSYLRNNADWTFEINKRNYNSQYDISYVNDREFVEETSYLTYIHSKYTFLDQEISNNKPLFEKKERQLPHINSILVPIESLNAPIGETNAEGELCPVCSSPLIFTEGCKKCVSCEYSACGT